MSNRSLRKQIRLCKQNRERLIEYYELLNSEYRKGSLSYNELEQRYRQKIGDKTAEQWVNFYNEEIVEFENELYGKENNKHHFVVFGVFILLAVLGYFAFTNPNIIGLFIEKETKQIDNVSYVINESSSYDLSLKGIPTSLRLTGALIGEGKVRVYLDNTLVLDNSLLEENGITSITGFAAYDNETINNPPEYNWIPDVYINKNEKTTINLDDYFFDIDSDNLKYSSTNPEHTVVLIEGSIATLIPDTDFTGFDYVTFAASDGIDSISSNEVFIYVVENESKLEPVALASETNNTENIIYDNLAIKEESNYTQNISEDNVTLPSAVEGNITEDRNITTAKGNITFITFEDVCKESCALFVNKTEFKLMIEIENAALNITQIIYTYKEIEETVKNITVENVTNNKPELVKQIPNIIILKNNRTTIDLSKYFFDLDFDKLSYDIEGSLFIVPLFNESIVTLIPDRDFVGAEFVKFIANDSKDIVYSNEVMISVVENVILDITINKSHIEENKTFEENVTTEVKGVVRINSPVRWVKKVKLNETVANITIALPEEAYNLSIVKIEENKTIEIDKTKVKVIYQDKIKTLDEFELDKKSELLEVEPESAEHKKNKEVSGIRGNLITGAVIGISTYNNEQTNVEPPSYAIENIYDNTNGSIADDIIINQSQSESDLGQGVNITEDVKENITELIIEENVTEVAVEYETPGPDAIENLISSNKKQIVVSSAIHYENILAYTLIEDVPLEAVKLYWLVNNTRQLVEFYAYDTNANNQVDYIEWIVPYLSNQTYEVEIIVLNVQSYPMVGDNWTVAFNTTGIANLTIIGINGTDYTEKAIDLIETNNTLDMLELRCGDEVRYNGTIGDAYYVLEDDNLFRVNATIGGSFKVKGIFIVNYSCSKTSYWDVKVLLPGIHTHEFRFGTSVAYAHNFAQKWSYALVNKSLGLGYGDIDGDGRDEIIVGTKDNFTIVLEHDGTFKWNYTNITWPGYVYKVKVADLDGDGVRDEVVYAVWNEHILFALNETGHLMWMYHPSWDISSWEYCPNNKEACNDMLVNSSDAIFDIDIGDVDGDNGDDIAVGIDYGMFVVGAGDDELNYDSNSMSLLMHFNNISNGTMAVDSANNYNGTLVGFSYNQGDSDWTNNSKLGSFALQCDGSDYVSIPDKDDWKFARNNFTIELWLRLNEYPADAISVLGQSNGGGAQDKWNIIINMNEASGVEVGKLDFHMNGATQANIVADWTPTIGRWYHIVFTRWANSWMWYVDGVKIRHHNQSLTVPDSTSTLKVCTDGELWKYMDGTIDELAIYNRSLTPSEIKSHYERGLNTSYLMWHTIPDESSGSSNIVYAVKMADIDGDNDKEVVEGRGNGTLYAWNDTENKGVLVWARDVGNSTHHVHAIDTAPGSDGKDDIFVGTDYYMIYGIDGANGNNLFSPYNTSSEILSIKAVDLDNDNVKDEVVAVTYNGTLYALNSDGSLSWKYNIGGIGYKVYAEKMWNSKWIITVGNSQNNTLMFDAAGLLISNISSGGPVWDITVINSTGAYGYDAIVVGTWAPTVIAYKNETAPAAFDLTSPANNTITTNRTPTLVWAETFDLDFLNYTVLIDNNADFSSPAFTYERTGNESNTTLKMPDSLAADLQYYWKVIAFDDIGNSRTSTNFFYYKTDNTVPSVALIRPLNNSWDNDGQVTFEFWATDSNNLSSCILYHNASGAFVANATNLTTTGLITGSIGSVTILLKDLTNIMWNVWCNDTAGSYAFNNSYNFTVNVDATAPTQFNLSEPANNTISTNRTPTLVWFNSTDANFENYTIQISTQKGFSSLVFNYSLTGNESNRTLSLANLFTLDANAQYYWRIIAFDKAGNSRTSNDYAASEFFWYKTDNTPPAIGLDKPLNNSWTNNSQVTFIFIANDTDLSTCVLWHNASGTFQANSTNSTATGLIAGENGSIVIRLKDLTNILWNIMCNDSAGNAAFNTTYNYTINVDTTSPEVGLNAPNNTWYRTSQVVFTFVPTDTNLQYCILYHNSSGTFVANETNTTSNGLRSGSDGSITARLSDSNKILWNVWCNDSAGNYAFNSTFNFTVMVDTITPTAFNVSEPSNNTISTNRTPTLVWFNTTDANFENYTIQIDNNSDFSSLEFNYSLTGNESNRTLKLANLFTLEADAQYYWRVIAFDKAGNNRTSNDYAANEFFWYKTDNTAPTVFDLELPGNYTIWTNRTPTLVWQATADSNFENYTIQIDNNSNFASIEFNYSLTGGVTNTTLSLQNLYTLQANMTHFWRVIAFDKSGNSRTSTNFFMYITDNAPPTLFDLTQPANNTITTNVTPTLVWSATTETYFVNYTIIIANNTDFNNWTYMYVIMNLTSNTTLKMPDSLSNDLQYYWKVIAFDVAGNNRTSNYTFWYKTDSSAPAAFDLQLPGNYTIWTYRTPTLVWQATTESNFENYTIQVDNNSDFVSLEFNYSLTGGVTNTTLSLQNLYTLQANMTHFWRVIAFDKSGNSRTSTNFFMYITDNTPPTLFDLTQPANNTITTNVTPTLVWSATTETYFVNYTIIIANNTDFNNWTYMYAIMNITSNTTLKMPDSLAADVQYYWKVIAFDIAGNNRTSNYTFWYKTDSSAPAAFDLQLPGNYTIWTNRTPTLVWQATTESNLENYTIQIDNNSDFASIEFNYSLTGSVDNNSLSLQNLYTLQANMTHFWRVIAFDKSGNSRTSTNFFMYITDNAPPTLFDLTQPANNTVTTNVTPTLVWSATTETYFVNYTIIIANNTDFNNWTYMYAIMNITSNTTLKMPDSLAADLQYYWKVIAFDIAGNNRTSNHTFWYKTDNSAPAVFDLTSPGNYTIWTNRTPTLVWQATTESNFENYTIQIDNNSNFASLEFNYSLTGGVDNNSLSLQNLYTLQANMTHFWRVIAFDKSGNSRTSTNFFMYITDNTPPTLFDLTQPANNTITTNVTPTLVWDVTTETYFVNYTIIIANNTDFNNWTYMYAIMNITSNTTLKMPDSLDADQQYYWKVIAFDIAGNNRTSNYTFWYKTDSSAPAAFNLTLPGNYTIWTNRTPTLVWQATTESNFENYTIQVDNNSDFVSLEFNYSLTGGVTNTTLSLQNLYTLQANMTHFWRVIAFDKSGNSRTSTNFFMYITDNTPPTLFDLTQPANNTITTNVTPTLVWGATTETYFVNYTIIIANNTDFNNWTYMYAIMNLTSNTTLKMPYSLGADLQYYWKVIAFDIAGNNRTSNYTFWYKTDNTGPSAFNLSLPSNYTVSANRTPTFVWFNTTDIDFKNYTFQIDNDSDFSSLEFNYSLTGGVTNTTLSLQNLFTLDADKLYYWRVIAFDEAGHNITSNDYAANEYFWYITDNSVPSIGLNIPINNSWLNSKSVTFTFIPTDSSLETCILWTNFTGSFTKNGSVYIGPLGSGEQASITTSLDDTTNILWNIWCNDSLGNSSFNTTYNYTFSIDTVLPSCPEPERPTLNNTYSNETRPTFNWTATNEIHFANYTQKIDDDKEFGSINYTFAVTTTSSDSNYTVSSPALGNDTPWWWTITVKDLAGNSVICDKWLYTTDNTNPGVFNLTAPANGTKSSESTPLFNWTATNETNFENYTVFVDNDSGFSSINFIGVTTDNVTNTTINTITLDDNVIYYWFVRAYDKAGNYRNSTSVYMYETDQNPPTVALVWPGNNSYLNPSNKLGNTGVFTFEFIPRDSNLDTCILYINATGTFAKNQTNLTSTGLTTSTINSVSTRLWYNLSITGRYTWNVWCNDSAGLSAFNTSNFTFGVDTISPTVFSLMLPENNTYSQNRTPTFVWFNTTDTTFVNYTLQIDTNEYFIPAELEYGIVGNISNTTFSIQGLNTLDPDQKYYWRVIAYDGAGNSRISNDNYFIYTTDNTPPKIALIRPNGTWYNNGTITFELWANDTNGVEACVLYHNASGTFVANETNLTVGGIIYHGTVKGGWYGEEKCDLTYLNSSYTVFDAPGDANTPHPDISNIHGDKAETGQAWNITSINSSSNISAGWIHTDFQGISNGNSSLSIQSRDWDNKTCVMFNYTFVNGTDFAYFITYDAGPSGKEAINIRRDNKTPYLLQFKMGKQYDNLSLISLTAGENWLIKICVVDNISSFSFDFKNSAVADSEWNISSGYYVNTSENRPNGRTDTFTFITGVGSYAKFRDFAIFNGTSESSCVKNMTTRPDNVSITAKLSDSSNIIWNVWCNDSSGNAAFNSTYNFTVKVDMVAPTAFNISEPTNNTISNNRTPNLVWFNSTDANFENYTIQISTQKSFSSLVFNYSLTGNESNRTLSLANLFTLDANAQYYWRIIAFDKAGNSRTSNDYAASEFFWYKTDNSVPEIGLDKPLNNSWTNNSQVTFIFIANDTDLSACELWHNASGAFTANATNSTATGLVAGQNGSITIRLKDLTNILWNVRCNDSAGNAVFNTTYNYTVNIDTIAPKVALIAPANDSWRRGNVTFEFVPLDDNIETCILYHDTSGMFSANATNSTVTGLIANQVGSIYALLPNYTNITWNIWCNDSAGNYAFNTTFNFTLKVDSNVPSSFNLSLPYNNTISTNRTPTLIWLNTSEDNFENYTIQIDNNSNFASIEFNYGLTGNVENTTLRLHNLFTLDVDAQYYWRVIAYDKAGNYRVSSEFYNYRTDNTVPKIGLDAPNNTWDNDGQLTFTFVPNDTNLETCVLYHNASGLFIANETNSTSNGLVSDNNASITARLSDSNNIIWNVWCNDSAGNYAFNSTYNFTIKVDTIAPAAFNMSEPANNTISSNRTPTLVWFNTTDLNFENYTLQVSKQKDFSALEFNYSLTGNESNRTLSLASLFTLEADVQYYWRVIAFDKASNNRTSNDYAASEFFWYKTDNVAPRISLDKPLNNSWTNNSQVTFIFIANDTDLSACELWHNASGTFEANATNSTATGLRAGENESITILLKDLTNIIWNVRCNDSAGNFAFNSTYNFTVNVDTTKPEVGLDAPNNTWYRTSQVVFTFVPTDTNLQTCILYHNSSGTFAANETNTTALGLRQGSNGSITARLSDSNNIIWNVWCNDSAGNYAFNLTYNFTVKVDTIAPTAFNVSEPANNTITSNRTPTLVWFNTTDANFENYTLQVSKQKDFSALEFNYSLTGNESNRTLKLANLFTLDADAQYYWRVIAFDKAGNSRTSNDYAASEFFFYRTDNSPPDIALIRPNDTWDTDGQVAFEFVASDPRLDTCIIYHNSSGTFVANETNLTRTGLISGNNASIIAKLNNSNNVMWNVWCNDSAGNAAFNSTFNFTVMVDTITPTAFNVSEPANNTISTNRTPTLVWFNTTDANFENYTIQISTQKTFSNLVFNYSLTGNESNRTLNLANLFTLGADAQYYWRVIAFDKAGNNRTSNDYAANEFFSYKTDNTAPIVGLDKPLNNSWTNNSQATFTFIPTDANLSTCVLWHNASGTFEANTTNSTATGLSTGNSASITTRLKDSTNIRWNIWCNDSLGNAGFNSTYNFTVNVDTTKPEVGLYAPNNTWYRTSQVTFTFVPTDTNLQTCILYHNSSGTFAANETNTTALGLRQGSNGSITARLSDSNNIIWNVWCNDSAGNYAFNSTYNFTVKVDTIAPTAFNVSEPANNTISSNRTPAFVWFNTTDANFENYTLQVSKQKEFSALEFNYSLTGNESNRTLSLANLFTLDADAQYYWRVIAFDKAGNSRTSNDYAASEFFWYKTDNSPPEIALVAPANNSWLTEEAKFIFVPTDTHLHTCVLWLTNESGHFAANETNSTNNGLVSGNNNSIFVALNNTINAIWNIWCNDSVGNSAFNNTFNYTVNVDTRVPEIMLISPSNGSHVKYDTLINLSVSDTYLNKAWYSKDRGVTNTTLATPYDIDTSAWDLGMYNITVWANDSANNVNQSLFTFTFIAMNISLSLSSQLVNTTQTINITGVLNFTNGTYINTNISIYVNGTRYFYNESLNLLVNYSTPNATKTDAGRYNYSFNSSNTEGIYIIIANASFNGFEASINLSLYVNNDNILPNISWIIPDTFNTSIFNANFNQNITFNDTNLYLFNCTIYSDLAQTQPVWSMQRDITGNSTYTKTDLVNIATFEDGTYYENCTAYDKIFP